jgi:hypothetical protein
MNKIQEVDQLRFIKLAEQRFERFEQSKAIERLERHEVV